MGHQVKRGVFNDIMFVTIWYFGHLEMIWILIQGRAELYEQIVSLFEKA